MAEKRFENRLNKDIKKFHALNSVWDNELKDALNVFEMIDEMNELQEEKEQLTKENNELKQLLKLIAEAETFTKVNSVKEVLRNEIKAIDTVTEYSAEAWKDYGILSKFFKEEYGEHWDNYD